MTARKASIATRLPVRRGLDEQEAAVYLSISPSFFRGLVMDGKMPRPRLLGTRRIWDVDDLDAAFKNSFRVGDGVVSTPGAGRDQTCPQVRSGWKSGFKSRRY